MFAELGLEYTGKWLIEVWLVFTIEATHCREGLLGSIEIDLACQALFESLCLFSLSVALEAADESLLVELLLALLVELPIDEV